MKTALHRHHLSSDRIEPFPTSSANRILKEMEWLEDFQFMNRECGLYTWLIRESLEAATESKRADLQLLNSKLLHFQQTQIIPGMKVARGLLQVSRAASISKRRAFSDDQHFEAFNALNTRIKSTKVEFRKLKDCSFNLIDRMMNARIF